MIMDLVEIFKARKDTALAAKLGSRFATGLAIERLSFPVLFLKFWMAVGLAVCTVLIIAILFGAYKLGWAAGLPVILPALVGYGTIRVWRGINMGLERVRLAAHDFTDAQIDNVHARIASRKGPV